MQDLSIYIKHNFNDDINAIADQLGVTNETIKNWITEGWTEEDDKIYPPDSESANYIVATNVFHSDEKFPIYYPDNAHKESEWSLILCVESGQIYVDQAYGSPYVFFRRKLTFKISKTLTSSEINNLINSHLKEFQQILNNASIEYDGSNFRGVFSADGLAVIDSLRYSLLDIESTEDNEIIEEVDGHLGSDPFGLNYNAKSLSDVESNFRQCVKNCGSYLSPQLDENLSYEISSYHEYILNLISDEELKEVPSWALSRYSAIL